MITAVGSTKELINSQQDASDPFHALVQVISLFTIDYAPDGSFSYDALSNDLFLDTVDLDTAQAIGASNKFDLLGYPVYLQLTDDEFQNGTVPGNWPSSTGQPWKDYKLGSLVWEEFELDVPNGVETVWTFGSLSGASRSEFSMSNLVLNLEPTLPPGADIIGTEARRSYNN